MISALCILFLSLMQIVKTKSSSICVGKSCGGYTDAPTPAPTMLNQLTPPPSVYYTLPPTDAPTEPPTPAPTVLNQLTLPPIPPAVCQCPCQDPCTYMIAEFNITLTKCYFELKYEIQTAGTPINYGIACQSCADMGVPAIVIACDNTGALKVLDVSQVPPVAFSPLEISDATCTMVDGALSLKFDHYMNVGANAGVVLQRFIGADLVNNGVSTPFTITL